MLLSDVAFFAGGGATMPKTLPYTLAWDTDGQTYHLLCKEQVCAAIIPGSQQWFDWLNVVASFAFHGRSGSFTARKETKQRGDFYWYAYKSLDKRLCKKYLGKTVDISLHRLEDVAAAIQLVPALSLIDKEP